MAIPGRYGQQARPLAEVDTTVGRNYTILSAHSVNSTVDNELKVTLLNGNRLGLTQGMGDVEEEYLYKTFKIQPCSDNNGANFVVSLYNSWTRQWALTRSGNGMEARLYPNLGAGGEEDPERLRPPQNRWRFAFQRTNLPKHYKIICMDEGLAYKGTNYLSIVGYPNENGEFQLGFSGENGNDLNQLWCFQEK